MQFKIPQNIDVEDQILPFLTMRQLIICCIGGGIAYLLYMSLESQPTEVWAPPVVFFVLITAAIAFVQVQGIPFTQYMLYVLEHYLNPQKRRWVKSAGDVVIHELPQKEANKPKVDPETTPGKKVRDLKELIKIVDSHGLVKN